jgi:putative thioredoxin
VVHDVNEAEFETRVVERSREVPVVVDFWAAWCGPCRALTPALEAAAARREGQVDLAKVDVDSNQGLAAGYGVRGIPAVKAFRDGGVVDEFTGALAPPQVERFFDGLVPSEADRLADQGDEGSLRRALELDPGHLPAARRLARLLLQRGEPAEASALLEPFAHDYVAAGLAARARLVASDGATPPREDHEAPAIAPRGLGEAFESWDGGDRETALERLQEAVAGAGPEERELLRRVMVAIFTELGPDDALARAHRRRLSAALN